MHFFTDEENAIREAYAVNGGAAGTDFLARLMSLQWVSGLRFVVLNIFWGDPEYLRSDWRPFFRLLSSQRAQPGSNLSIAQWSISLCSSHSYFAGSLQDDAPQPSRA